ncbi:hypothetical protein N7444_013392 [Penicillium canescens]|nr:hypothetical protein N7444_013392 [Penicillium canescens]
MHGQPWHGLAAIATLASCALANPLAYWNVVGNASLNTERLMARNTTEFDLADLSFIKSMAAIGDSYSAGIGAGSRLGSCYDNSYPYLTDERLGDQAARTFWFESCSGAVTDDVLNDQIPNINGNQQVILLSAGMYIPVFFPMNWTDTSDVLGGNDAELSNILNQCLGCHGQLARTQKLISRDAFGKSLDSVISAAKLKLASELVTILYRLGLNADQSYLVNLGSCEWQRNDGQYGTNFRLEIIQYISGSAKLTKDLRKTMNDLINALAVVKRAGDQVKFVDYDYYVGYFNSSFCEEGFDELTKESNIRTGLMFYELNTGTSSAAIPRNEARRPTRKEHLDPKFTDQTMISDESTASTASIEGFSASDVVSLKSAAISRRGIPNLLLDE